MPNKPVRAVSARPREYLIAAEKGRPVRAKDLASKLHIFMDQAYSKLRYAGNVGAIQRANKSEKSNHKLFLPVSRPNFVPDPKEWDMAVSALLCTFSGLIGLPSRRRLTVPIAVEMFSA